VNLIIQALGQSAGCLLVACEKGRSVWDTKVASLLLKLVVIVRSGSKSNAGAIIVPAKEKVEGRTDGLPFIPNDQ
jgi:hypothetical protein